jgi:hypothetical protein
VASALRIPVDCVPLSALLPDQAPEAEHDVALVAVQRSIELVPLASVLGEAAILTAGAAAFNETVADCVALPPAPVQVRI